MKSLTTPFAEDALTHLRSQTEERTSILQADAALDPSDAQRRATMDVSVHAFRQFMGISPTETIELTAFDRVKRVHVAYARTIDDQLRLMKDADHRSDVSGIYTCVNEVHPGLYARIGEGMWMAGASRASDRDVTLVRAVYLDFDCLRPRDISATDTEKAEALDVCCRCEEYLAGVLGASCLGRGDSGNGSSLFVAMEPTRPSLEAKRRIDKFLRAMSVMFSTDVVKVDTSVGNPSRLCPAFGTMKRKGIDCADRPHRPTWFWAPERVVRLRWEVL